LKPVGTGLGRVYSEGVPSANIYATITYSDLYNLTKVYKVPLKNGVNLDVSDEFSFQIDGSFDSFFQGFLKYKYVTLESCSGQSCDETVPDYGFAAASDLNAPSACTIGDVQTDLKTISDVSQNPSRVRFSKDISIMNSGDTSGSIFAACSDESNYHSQSGYGVGLLKQRNLWGALWVPSWNENSKPYQVTTLEAFLDNPGGFMATITSKKILTMRRKITVVCPTVKVVSSTGCYSCPMGFSIVLLASSTCSEGVAAVTVDSKDVVLSTNSIALSTVETSYTIYGFTSLSQNDWTISVIGTNSASTGSVSFIASDYSGLSYFNYSDVNASSEKNSSSFWSQLENSFSKLVASLGGSVAFSFEIIAAILVLILSFYILKLFCCSSNRISFQQPSSIKLFKSSKKLNQS